MKIILTNVYDIEIISQNEMLTSKEIIQLLLNAGFEAYYIGGCVRDRILNIECNDEDIVTNAKDFEIINTLKLHATVIKRIGQLFGVILVDSFEIATYRSDQYINGKLSTTQINSLELDCARRDYTINAIAMDINGNIYDWVGGIEDIKNKVLKTNGDPLIRFQEDPSRILRGIYFEVKLNFTFESHTLEILLSNVTLINKIEPNVISRIFSKVFKNKLFHLFIDKLIQYQIFQLIFGFNPTGDDQMVNLLSEANFNELISYAIIFRNNINHIQTISYLMQKKYIQMIIFIINSDKILSFNQQSWSEIVIQMKNRTELNKLIELIIQYKKILQKDFDPGSFWDKFYSTIYYSHELPIEGVQLMKLGFDGKAIGNIMTILIKNNCRTLKECIDLIKSTHVSQP